jgi:twitching motility two-component system response regulator PilH
MKNILFMNFFNRQNADSADLSAAPKTADFEVFKGLTALIVDDSRTQLYAMEKILNAAGILTITAENGKQGILMARHKRPDFILMDIVMPEINGFQATRYLSRHDDTAHIPIIIISGSNQESDKAWGLKLGARDFMHKPVNKDELFAKLGLLMNERVQAERAKHAS